MFVSKLTPEQWAEVRRLHAGGIGFAELGRRFGLARTTIQGKARRDGWSSAGPAPVPASVALLVAPRRAGSPKLPRRHGAAAPLLRTFAYRVLRIIDLDLQITEMRMQKQLDDAQQDKEVPAAGIEADFKRVGTYIKTVKDLTELQTDAASTSGAGGKSRSAASEADVFRREIAERIEKLIPPS